MGENSVSIVIEDSGGSYASNKSSSRERITTLLRWTFIVFGYSVLIYTGIQTTYQFRSKIEGNRVRDGWIPSLLIDLSDHQWRQWRQNILKLLFGLSIYVLFLKDSTIRRIADLVALVYIHGVWGAFMLLSISSLNYIATKTLPKRMVPVFTWIWNVAWMILADYYQGFYAAAAYIDILNQYRGLLRWNIYFKMTVLRNISFAMDCSSNSDSHDNKYSYLNMLSYVCYIPLFIAGPIISYDSFITQRTSNSHISKSTREVWKSLLVVLLYMLALDVWLHFFHINALNEYQVWKEDSFTPLQMFTLAYWMLNFMYMKFLIIWKFFSVFANLDGLEVPNNMLRCVNNNFTFTGFWRSWHSSFNKWIVKYLYVPLGGNKRRAQIIWIVFFFVGIWHDLMIRWIVWALLNCVFFSLEILILTQFHSSTALQPSLPQHSNSEDHNAQEHHKTHKDHSGMNEYVQQVFHWIKTSKWMEVVIGVSGTVNIYLLMIANLSLLYGMDTFPFMEKAFLSNSSLFILCCASLWLFCGVILMREMESKSKQSSIKDYSKK